MPSRAPDPTLCWLAATVAALMCLATAAAVAVGHAYDAAGVSLWAEGIARNPGAATLSAWAFAVGLVASAAAYVVLLVRTPAPWPSVAVAGVVILAGAALLDAAASLAPHLVAWQGPGEAAILALAGAIALDAMHNGALGVGFILTASAFARALGAPVWFPWAQRAIGACLLPAALQSVVPGADVVILFSGWLWVAWWVAVAWMTRPGSGLDG